MPPRKSVGRTSTATPARTTRATSAVAVENSAGKRATRVATRQSPARDDVVNNPQLPELQTQQSYAYGSTKTPALPEQLSGKDPSNLRQIADDIDDKVDEADEHFESHLTGAQENLETSPQLGRTRQTKSRERLRAPSEKPQPVQTEKEARIAAWADSLDESQLDDIAEEDSSQSDIQDDATHRDTDPSSFPSVILDHSYNYERGLRKPRPTAQEQAPGPSHLQRILARLKDVSSTMKERLGDVWASSMSWLRQMGDAAAAGLKAVPQSPLIAATVSVLAAAVLIATAGFLFCSLYTRVLCDNTSTSMVAVNLQKLCGSCHVAPSTFNLSNADSLDLSKISAALLTLSKQIQDTERRLERRIDGKHAALESEMESLKQQHSDLSNHMQHLHYSQPTSSSEGIASPLIPKINFFAPSNGAVIVPIHSSPTRARQKALAVRVLLFMTGMTKHQANPPITALEPWQDVGDCWCGPDVAPDQDVMRLAVTTQEMLYPTELIVEHFPASGSLHPETAPKKLELWADFSHLDYDSWQKLRLSDMQEGNQLSSRHARLGEMHYDASGRQSHVQTFRLDVNQQGLVYAAKEFTVRVKENNGGRFGCLYRLRLHGVPVDAPNISTDGEWFADHGYQSESD